MAYESFEWRCGDGTRMFACAHEPETRSGVRAVIGIVHGMGEHTELYRHVAEMFVEQGYAVLLFDQRGHGQTEGQRGHAPTYEHLLEGIDRMLEEADKRYPGVPRFLYGHSMGGNVTVNYLLRRKPDIQGAIISSPWLKLAFDPPKLTYVMGSLMERLYPQYSNYRPMRPNNLTSDPVMIRRIEEDTVRHGHITARFFFGVARAGRWALQHAAELGVPILLLHGGNDKVTSIHASRQFSERSLGKAEFREWPGLKHELHNELDRDTVFTAMVDWVERRLQAQN